MLKLKQYAKETSIHGFQELLQYKSWAFRVSWSLVLLGFFGFFVHQTVVALTKYLDKPMATQVSYKRGEGFPDFAICTNDWMNTEAMRADFPTKDDMRILIGSICPSVDRPSTLSDGEDGGVWLDNTTETQANETVRKVRKMAADLGSYENLLRKYALDFYGDLAGRVNCKPCVNRTVPVKIVMKDVGPCWYFQPGNLTPPTGRASTYPFLDIQITFATYGAMDQNSIVSLYIGSSAADPTAQTDVGLRPGASNVVDVLFTRQTRAANCNKSADHKDGYCLSQCVDATRKHCGLNCRVYLGDAYWTNTTEPYCNYPGEGIEPEFLKCMQEHEKLCRGCLRRCDRLLASPKIDIRPLPGSTHSMHVRFRLQNLYNILHYEEYYSYLIEDLLSDFGGLLGLFLGASIVSMMHTIYFCLIMPFFCGKKVGDDGSDEQDGQEKGG